MTDHSELSANELISGDRLARNSILSLVSQALPLALTIVVLPILIRQLGADRFSILTFLWTALAYMGVSDFGVGYVTTQLVAARLATEDRSGVSEIFWTCTGFLMTVGIVLMLALFLLTPWLIQHGLSVPVIYRPEAYRSLLILALCLPISVVAMACRGLLEAYQKFELRNAIMVANGVLMLIAPVVAAMLSKRLDVIALALLASRVVIFVFYAVSCLTTVKVLRQGIRLRAAIARQAFTLGGWMTLMNIASPILQYSDRFIISSLVSVAAVGYYFVPYELSTRLLIIIGSITVVLMPAFAMTVEHDGAKAARLFGFGLKVGLCCIFMPTFAVSAVAAPLLSIWLGETMAQQSSTAMQVILIGVFFNAAAIMGLSFILGAGRPDLAAKLQLVELIAYLPVVFILIGRFGITGAAVAYVARMVFDSLLMLWLSHRLMRSTPFDLKKPLVLLMVGALALAGLLLPLPPLAIMTYAIMALSTFYLFAWHIMFTREERAIIFWILGSATTAKFFRRRRNIEP